MCFYLSVKLYNHLVLSRFMQQKKKCMGILVFHEKTWNVEVSIPHTMSSIAVEQTFPTVYRGLNSVHIPRFRSLEITIFYANTCNIINSIKKNNHIMESSLWIILIINSNPENSLRCNI